ncbi:MAG: site-2 protease family protein [Polyangiaceae bacterium]|nr:site-2 protease family protein [Polyangiaceae bacterium]
MADGGELQTANATVPRPRKRWSVRIARIAGIDVFVHATFVLLAVWYVAGVIAAGAAPAEAFLPAFYVAAIFGCVVLHELGHALMARRFGIRTRDITLYPIGGIASLERIPSEPKAELLIALAGPAVNLVLAGGLALLGAAVPGLMGLGHVRGVEQSLLTSLLGANLFLAVFNLVPAFPMDGGRVLRALLAGSLERARATRIAALIGQALAVSVMVGVLVLGWPVTLLFIGVIVLLGAGQEVRMVEREVALVGVTVAGAMETRLDVLSPLATLRDAERLLLASAQSDFAVVDREGRPVGMLGREELIGALAAESPDQPVAGPMRTRFPVARVDERATEVLQRTADLPWRAMPVVDEAGRLVGLLTIENVSELVMLKAAHAARSHAVAR